MKPLRHFFLSTVGAFFLTSCKTFEDSLRTVPPHHLEGKQPLIDLEALMANFARTERIHWLFSLLLVLALMALILLKYRPGKA